MSDHIQKQINDINNHGVYQANYGKCDDCGNNDVIANVEGEIWLCEWCVQDFKPSDKPKDIADLEQLIEDFGKCPLCKGEICNEFMTISDKHTVIRTYVRYCSGCGFVFETHNSVHKVDGGQ